MPESYSADAYQFDCRCQPGYFFRKAGCASDELLSLGIYLYIRLDFGFAAEENGCAFGKFQHRFSIASTISQERYSETGRRQVRFHLLCRLPLNYHLKPHTVCHLTVKR
ncbi:MAG: hypothetical protein ACLSAF_13925 [Intestinimonas sp.]